MINYNKIPCSTSIEVSHVISNNSNNTTTILQLPLFLILWQVLMRTDMVTDFCLSSAVWSLIKTLTWRSTTSHGQFTKWKHDTWKWCHQSDISHQVDLCLLILSFVSSWCFTFFMEMNLTKKTKRDTCRHFKKKSGFFFFLSETPHQTQQRTRRVSVPSCACFQSGIIYLINCEGLFFITLYHTSWPVSPVGSILTCLTLLIRTNERSCVLSTCLTANLGSALQGGDETAGGSTKDPFGIGKKWQEAAVEPMTSFSSPLSSQQRQTRWLISCSSQFSLIQNIRNRNQTYNKPTDIKKKKRSYNSQGAFG